MFTSRYSRWGSPAIFAGILLAFLLPFATVSCGDEEVTFTGVQLATEQVPQAETESRDEPLSEEVESSSSHWAFVALVAAAVGFGLGIAGRRGGGIAAATGLLGLLCLLLSAAGTLADVDIHVGFGLALLGDVAAATHHAVAARRRRRAARDTPPRARSRRRRVAAAVLVLFVLGAVTACGALVVAADESADPAYVDFDTADSGPAWSPDGGEIAFERGGAVHTVKPDGSCPRRVTAGSAPAWSPKGDLIAVTRCDGDACSIVVVSRDGSDERELVAGQFFEPSWSGDGTHVYLSREEEDSTTTWVVRADGTELRRLAPPWIEPDDRRWSPAAAGEDDPTFSPDDTSYAFASSDDPTVGIDALQEAIFVRSIRGGDRRQLSDPPVNAGDYEPAWSPDGERISFQRSGEIALMDADGSHQRVLTHVDGATTSAWSPDSSEIVFTRELYGGKGYASAPSALMIVDIDSGDTRRLTWGPAAVAACKSG